jgi:hypothetical protein
VGGGLGIGDGKLNALRRYGLLSFFFIHINILAKELLLRVVNFLFYRVILIVYLKLKCDSNC